MAARKLIIVAALLAAAALAQPAFNAPLLPEVNFIDGGNTAAVVGAVVAPGYAFTANSAGVWAHNSTAPAGSMAGAPFWDALPGVTQLWSYCANYTNMSTCSVVAIAGSAIVQYKFNDTNVWRSAAYWAKNATFDINSYPNTSPSFQYPAMVSSMTTGKPLYVLGTRNTSTTATNMMFKSTLYAFDADTLAIEWETIVNADTTNFAISVSENPAFVWVLIQNRSYSTSDVYVRQVYVVNGSLSDWSLDTGMYSSTNFYLTVQFDQLFVIASGGHYTYASLNGTIFQNAISVSSCSTMPYAPIVINGTWYAVCGSRIYTYNNMTGMSNTLTTSYSIDCGAIHEFNMDIILVDQQSVYVLNASGLSTLLTLPASLQYPTGGYQSTCTGARFNWIDPAHIPMGLDMNLTDIVHLSFSGYYTSSGGNVVALNYRTGEALVQAAGDLTAIGAPVIDFMTRRLVVASTNGHILQHYEFVPLVNSTTFAVRPSSDSSVTFSVAYNASNRSTYYINRYGAYLVDYKGNAWSIGTFSYIQSSIQPVIVGQYFVFFDSYDDTVYVYNSVTAAALLSVSTCDQDNQVAPVWSGTKLILFCTGSSNAANIIDVSATSLTAVSVSADNYRYSSGAVVIDTTLIITTGYSKVSGYDFTATSFSTSKWDLTTTSDNLYYVYCPLVAYNDDAYFTAQYYNFASGDGFVNYVWRVSTGGSATRVGKLMYQESTNNILQIKSGGVFGGALLYVIGQTNITAYTLSWDVQFNYHSNKTIYIQYQNNPTVLDTGAVCFYTTDGFNVVGGFEGNLAWTYPATTGQFYPVLTDNATIYFSDGRYVVGANSFNGAVTSQTAYLDGNVQGFAIAGGENWTTVIAANDNSIVFGQMVGTGMFAPGGATGGSGSNSFPGSGSAPSGNGAFGEESKSKLWIIGVVVGVIVVIAIVIFVATRGSGGSKTDDNYVPMNPATQV